jgi:hypothetical protein
MLQSQSCTDLNLPKSFAAFKNCFWTQIKSFYFFLDQNRRLNSILQIKACYLLHNQQLPINTRRIHSQIGPSDRHLTTRLSVLSNQQLMH